MAGQLLDHPLPQQGMVDPGEHSPEHAVAHRAGGQAHHLRGGRNHLGQELATRPQAEVARRGAEHQARDLVRMAPPGELGDRTAHAVADGDEALDAQGLGRGGRVVGALTEAEAAGAQALAVAPVVQGQHPEVLGQGAEARPPVEARRGAQAVE